jgi:hypothetical protein
MAPDNEPTMQPVKSISRRSAPWALALVLLLTASAASADAVSAVGKIKVIEQAIEALRDQVLLPSDATGVLVVTPCRGCTPVSLTATSSTQWTVGKNVVRFVQLRDHVRTSPRTQITVFYNKSLGALTRVVATAR